jgi:Archaeal/vacuolar-type H+-ATPase subunit E
MDVQLQELVEKIRKDGVETAEARAAEIVKAAETKAATIIRTAQSEAASIVKNAQAEADRSEKAAVSAISQSGRNLLISFRDGIIAELDGLVRSETTRAYDSAILKELIPAAVKAWIRESGCDDIAVLLSPADASALAGGFNSALKAELAKGLEIRSDSAVGAGFRIGTRDGASYYDFSAEAVAGLFSAYLNPRVAEILKSAAKEL